MFRNSIITNSNNNVFIPSSEQINCQFCGLLFKNQVALNIHFDERHRFSDSFQFQGPNFPDTNFNESRENLRVITLPHNQEPYTHVLPPRNQPIENRDEFIAANTIYNAGKATWDCLLCRKAFRVKNDLYQHLRSGTHEAKRFPCVDCGRTFASLGAQAQHAEQAGHTPICQQPSGPAFTNSRNQNLPMNQPINLPNTNSQHSPEYRSIPFNGSPPSAWNQPLFNISNANLQSNLEISGDSHIEYSSSNQVHVASGSIFNSFHPPNPCIARHNSSMTTSPDRSGMDFRGLSDLRLSDLSLPPNVDVPMEYNYRYTIEHDDDFHDEQLSTLSTTDSPVGMLTYASVAAQPIGRGTYGDKLRSVQQPVPQLEYVLSVTSVTTTNFLHGGSAFILSDAHTGTIVCQHAQPVNGFCMPGNLVPEYEALYAGLNQALRRGVRRLLVRSDSNNMLVHLNTGVITAPSFSLPSASTNSVQSQLQSQSYAGAVTQQNRAIEEIAQKVRKCCAELQQIRFEHIAAHDNRAAQTLARMVLPSEY